MRVDNRRARLAVTEQLKKVGEAQYSSAGFTGAVVCSQYVQLPWMFLFMKMLGGVFPLHQNQETQH